MESRSCRKAPLFGISVLTLSLLVTLGFSENHAFALTSISYDFNTQANLDDNFDSHISTGSVVWSSTGGINNSGAINAPGSANAVFTSTAGYSLAGAGSTYRFESFIESVGNSGYSGMGFTTLAASSPNDGRVPYRMNDALGVSVHGGGFVFHNGTSDVSGLWNGQYTGTDNLFTVVRSTNLDGALVEGTVGNGLALLNGHRYADDSVQVTSKWYKLVLNITVRDAGKFDMRLEAYRAKSDGTLITPDPDAVYELRDLENTTVANAPTIRSYINFSGDRVRFFDGFQIDLGGGGTVIAAGTPVVLTFHLDLENGEVSVVGTVSSDGGFPSFSPSDSHPMDSGRV